MMWATRWKAYLPEWGGDLPGLKPAQGRISFPEISSGRGWVPGPKNGNKERACRLAPDTLEEAWAGGPDDSQWLRSSYPDRPARVKGLMYPHWGPFSGLELGRTTHESEHADRYPP
jgi:hypothetical protein